MDKFMIKINLLKNKNYFLFMDKSMIKIHLSQKKKKKKKKKCTKMDNFGYCASFA